MELRGRADPAESIRVHRQVSRLQRAESTLVRTLEVAGVYPTRIRGGKEHSLGPTPPS